MAKDERDYQRRSDLLDLSLADHELLQGVEPYQDTGGRLFSDLDLDIPNYQARAADFIKSNQASASTDSFGESSLYQLEIFQQARSALPKLQVPENSTMSDSDLLELQRAALVNMRYFEKPANENGEGDLLELQRAALVSMKAKGKYPESTSPREAAKDRLRGDLLELQRAALATMKIPDKPKSAKNEGDLLELQRAALAGMKVPGKQQPKSTGPWKDDLLELQRAALASMSAAAKPSSSNSSSPKGKSLQQSDLLELQRAALASMKTANLSTAGDTKTAPQESGDLLELQRAALAGMKLVAAAKKDNTKEKYVCEIHKRCPDPISYSCGCPSAQQFARIIPVPVQVTDDTFQSIKPPYSCGCRATFARCTCATAVHIPKETYGRDKGFNPNIDVKYSCGCHAAKTSVNGMLEQLLIELSLKEKLCKDLEGTNQRLWQQMQEMQERQQHGGANTSGSGHDWTVERGKLLDSLALGSTEISEKKKRISHLEADLAMSRSIVEYAKRRLSDAAFETSKIISEAEVIHAALKEVASHVESQDHSHSPICEGLGDEFPGTDHKNKVLSGESSSGSTASWMREKMELVAQINNLKIQLQTVVRAFLDPKMHEVDSEMVKSLQDEVTQLQRALEHEQDSHVENLEQEVREACSVLQKATAEFQRATSELDNLRSESRAEIAALRHAMTEQARNFERMLPLSSPQLTSLHDVVKRPRDDSSSRAYDSFVCDEPKMELQRLENDLLQARQKELQIEEENYKKLTNVVDQQTLRLREKEARMEAKLRDNARYITEYQSILKYKDFKIKELSIELSHILSSMKSLTESNQKLTQRLMTHPASSSESRLNRVRDEDTPLCELFDLRSEVASLRQLLQLKSEGLMLMEKDLAKSFTTIEGLRKELHETTRPSRRNGKEEREMSKGNSGEVLDAAALKTNDILVLGHEQQTQSMVTKFLSLEKQKELLKATNISLDADPALLKANDQLVAGIQQQMNMIEAIWNPVATTPAASIDAAKEQGS